MRTFGDVLNFTRNSILRDIEDPYLWEDDALVECIAQAHDEFAERTHFIRDTTSTLTSFALIAGVDQYTLDPAVLSILSAKIDGAQTNLVRASSPALDGYVPPPDVVAWLESINYGMSQTGTPQVFTTDESSSTTADGGAGPEQTMAVTVRVWPTPATADAGTIVRLRISRLPLVQCSLDTLTHPVECPRQAIMGLAHGAAMYAYGMQDSDGGDSSRGDKQRALFEGYIERIKSSARSKMFQPLAWGFGRGGFNAR